MPEVIHSMKKSADEDRIRIEAGIRVANLKNGGRRITHPSGLVCIESPEQIVQERVRLADAVTDAQAQLDAHDLELNNG